VSFEHLLDERQRTPRPVDLPSLRFFLVLLTADGLLEVADALPESPAQLRNTAGAEDQDHDEQDEEYLTKAKTAEHDDLQGSRPGRRAQAPLRGRVRWE